MKYNRDINHRRSLRLKNYDYSDAGAYYVTICAWQRECLFGEIMEGEMRLNEYGIIVEQFINMIPSRYAETDIDYYVIMPNHIHAIIMIQSAVGVIHELPLQKESFIKYRKQRRQMLLTKIVGWLKMNSSKCINQIRNSAGRPVWQRNYYEHIIRTDKELTAIRKYIQDNPLQWALDEENPANTL